MDCHMQRGRVSGYKMFMIFHVWSPSNFPKHSASVRAIRIKARFSQRHQQCYFFFIVMKIINQKSFFIILTCINHWRTKNSKERSGKIDVSLRKPTVALHSRTFTKSGSRLSRSLCWCPRLNGRGLQVTLTMCMRLCENEWLEVK